MTQQPYPPQQGYPPQYPQAPQQPYAQPGYPPQQGYPPQAPQQPYAQPGYPPQQGYGQPAPQQPAVPLAQGSLDQFYSQPSAGGGPSIGWMDRLQQQRPVGTTWFGVVARDVLGTDVQQQTDIKTQQPLFYRDGRPKFAMKVPLKQVMLRDPQGNFLATDLPEDEGTWYVKGQGRDELNRAMAEAGITPAPGELGVSPKAGAVISITLVNRRPTGGGMHPANVVQVAYQPAEGSQTAAPAPAPQSVQEQPPAQAYAPPAAPPQQGYAPPAAPPQQQQQYPPQGYAPQAQQPPQGAPTPPPAMSPEQAALLAKITGQPAA